VSARPSSRDEKPRAAKKESAYFENDELPIVFAALTDENGGGGLTVAVVDREVISQKLHRKMTSR